MNRFKALHEGLGMIYIASKEKTQKQLETAEELIIQVEQYIEKISKNATS